MENTQENEILKPEPIELRPEDLVSGEVYTFSLPKNDWKWTFKFKGLNLEKKHDQIEYYRLYVHHDKELIINSSCSHREKYYHATPEEKALLLGEEEPTDWEAMYNELKDKYDALVDSHSRLEFYDKELENVVDEQSELIKKIQNDQLEHKGEKVYFYFNENKGHITYTESLEVALNLSPQDSEIYEGFKIGVKKSVLVNENS